MSKSPIPFSDLKKNKQQVKENNNIANTENEQVREFEKCANIISEKLPTIQDFIKYPYEKQANTIINALENPAVTDAIVTVASNPNFQNYANERISQRKLEELLKKYDIKSNVSEFLKTGVDALKNPTEINKIKSIFLEDLKKIKDDRINAILNPKSPEPDPFASLDDRFRFGGDIGDDITNGVKGVFALPAMIVCCGALIIGGVLWPFYKVGEGALYVGKVVGDGLINEVLVMWESITEPSSNKKGGKRMRSKKRKATKRTNRRRSRGRTHRK